VTARARYGGREREEREGRGVKEREGRGEEGGTTREGRGGGHHRGGDKDETETRRRLGRRMRR